jgi:hypothetical protein
MLMTIDRTEHLPAYLTAFPYPLLQHLPLVCTPIVVTVPAIVIDPMPVDNVPWTLQCTDLRIESLPVKLRCGLECHTLPYGRFGKTNATPPIHTAIVSAWTALMESISFGTPAVNWSFASCAVPDVFI